MSRLSAILPVKISNISMSSERRSKIGKKVSSDYFLRWSSENRAIARNGQSTRSCRRRVSHDTKSTLCLIGIDIDGVRREIPLCIERNAAGNVAVSFTGTNRGKPPFSDQTSPFHAIKTPLYLGQWANFALQLKQKNGEHMNYTKRPHAGYSDRHWSLFTA